MLGPFAVPFSIGTLGFGPGIGIFTAFGLVSVYCGYLIWRVFMGVDSHEFPARNYGDLAFRAWGTGARHVVNVLQALALLLLLGQVTILFGQNISELSRYRICYIVCPLIFVLVGFVLTQIRTLRNFGWLANFGFWFNILAIFISMGATAHNPPNFAISTLGSVGSESCRFVSYTFDDGMLSWPSTNKRPRLNRQIKHYTGCRRELAAGEDLWLSTNRQPQRSH